MIRRAVKTKEQLQSERLERRKPKIKSERARDIQAACARAKTRDKFCCLLTGKRQIDGYLVDASHLLTRSNPAKGYDPANPDFIFTIERPLHQEYERLGNWERLAWLEARPKLRVFAERLRKLLEGEG